MEYGVLGKKNDLFSAGSSLEDNMKFRVRFDLSRDEYDRSLYLESARRVIFNNCMTALELDDKKVPNFNRNFYYNQKETQVQLEECYNTRMNLHFGAENAKQHQLLIDFDKMFHEYQNYERWHPQHKVLTPYTKGQEETKVQSVISHLREKTAKANSNDYSF